MTPKNEYLFYMKDVWIRSIYPLELPNKEDHTIVAKWIKANLP